MRHVVLVGATDGIGRALADEYLRRGWRIGLVGRERARVETVVEGLRASSPGSRVVGVRCDVARTASIPHAFEKVLLELGQMDLLVYCAGVLRSARTTGERLEGASPMLDVNVRGAVHFLELGAHYLESLGRGRLAAIGSVAGVRGRKGNPVYGATKAALHAYLDGLRHRLHPYGVGVSTIKPGFVRTRMLADDVPGFPPTISPERAARTIADRLDRGDDAFFVPWWWGAVAAPLRLAPTFLHKRLAPP